VLQQSTTRGQGVTRKDGPRCAIRRLGCGDRGGASVDGARQAAATLDWLRQNGYQHLLARSFVVINHLIPGNPGVDVADLVAQFQRYVAPGRVVVLPWDKHVAAGTEIQLDLINRRFRRRIAELAAALSDDFDSIEQHATPRWPHLTFASPASRT
jgi:MinD-like ATPase involved in chromosome partitioning or flagellar assembly